MTIKKQKYAKKKKQQQNTSNICIKAHNMCKYKKTQQKENGTRTKDNTTK